MTPLHFTKNDVDRVAAILDNSPEWVDADDVDTRALAFTIVDQMTCDGHAPETVSPLRYRTVYGLAAYLRLIADHTHDAEEGTGDPDLEDLAWEGDEPVSTGDVFEDGRGLSIVTPGGNYWHLTDEQALSLVTGLVSMLRGRLTRPWSADDSSTILSRGRAAEERARLEEV